MNDSMNDLKLLLKIDFMNLFGMNKAIHCKDPSQKIKLWGFSVLMIIVAVMLIFISSVYNFMIASGLKSINAMTAFSALMMLVSSLTALFTTVYKVNGVLFEFRDYDEMMALPIKTSTVVLSRILTLYGLNLGFCCLIMVPAGVIYYLMANMSYAYIPIFLVTLFLIPLIPVVIASVFGLIISLLAHRFKHRNMFNLIFTFAFFICVILFQMRINGGTADYQAIGQILLQMIHKLYPPALLYAKGVGGNDLLSLFLFVAASVIVFFLFVCITTRYFKKINTYMTSGFTVSNFKLKSVKSASPLFALYKKEIKRYFTSPIYVFNTAFGMILLVILSVYMLFTGPQLLNQMVSFSIPADMLYDGLLLLISFCTVLSCTSVCSISLEGRNLWIVKSIPVSYMTLFWSKMAVNLTILIPPVTLSAILFCFVIKPTLLQGLMLFILPFAYSLFTSLMGIAVNVFIPKFDWQSDAVVVKRSAATMIAVILGLISLAIPVILLFVLPKGFPGIMELVSALIILIADYFLYRFIQSVCVRKFELL